MEFGILEIMVTDMILFHSSQGLLDYMKEYFHKRNFIPHTNTRSFFILETILTPFNEVATEINTELLDRMQEQISVLFKEDTAEVEDPTLQE